MFRLPLVSFFIAATIVALPARTDPLLIEDDQFIPGAALIQLSDEDEIEPFDSRKIASFLISGLMSEQEFFDLMKQGVSEEQFVAVLKRIYDQQGIEIEDGKIIEIVHEKLFPETALIAKEATVSASFERGMQKNSCGNTQAEEEEPKKKKVKKGPDFPYAVQKLANTFCGSEEDYILDYDLSDSYSKKPSKIRWWHKDWWVRALFGKVTVNVCQKPQKACLGGVRLSPNPGKAWDLQLWLEK